MKYFYNKSTLKWFSVIWFSSRSNGYFENSSVLSQHVQVTSNVVCNKVKIRLNRIKCCYLSSPKIFKQWNFINQSWCRKSLDSLFVLCQFFKHSLKFYNESGLKKVFDQNDLKFSRQHFASNQKQKFLLVETALSFMKKVFKTTYFKSYFSFGRTRSNFMHFCFF